MYEMLKHAGLVWSVLSALVLAARSASAHDAPRVYAMLERGSEGAVMLTNRGLIFGEPSAGSYRLLCNEALGFNTAEEPNAVLLPDGSLLIATSGGVRRTEDEGCTVTDLEPFAATNAPALAQDPSDAARLYLATYEPPARSGIYVSSDAGASFMHTYEMPETRFLEELLVAPSAPAIVYASGFNFSNTGPEREQLVLRSADSGASFESITVELAANEADLTLLAISPSDSDMLLARALDDGATTRLDRLLVSRDGGRAWREALVVHQLFGAGFTAGAVWVTGIDGLYRSEDGAESFVQVQGPTTMAGVVEWSGESLVCGRFALGRNGIASVRAGSAELTPWFELTEVTAPVQCEPGTRTAETCATLWLDWQREILAGALDAGTEPPGTEPPVADAGELQPARTSSGCALAARANTHAAWATWVLAMLAYAARRRR